MVVIGIDMGTQGSVVGFVGKGNVDMVQNEVSQRTTSSLVGYTSKERLLGDAALAQIRSNAKGSCRGFKHLLGQKVDAVPVEKEHFWSTSALTVAADGLAGYDINYKGEPKIASAPQVTAAFLTKLREITESWCKDRVSDVVIGVPSYYSDIHRQAMLDAAKIANLSVLRLMNEHAATALAYGIYRSADFDAEKPSTVAFCSLGHAIFSVSIVQFFKGKLVVLCEASDKVGGRDMDECLMREFAGQFKKKFGCDPLSNKKASFKLEDAVTKTKKVLSANYEAPVNVECLMEDEDFSSLMTREDLEKMCGPMMEKTKAVLEKAKAMSGLTADQIDIVEIVGGSSRVPWWKKMCSEAFGGKELSTTMNADESVARGCALQAAMLSPLYKVRDFKVEDCSPYAISLGWHGSAADAEASKEEDGDQNMGGAEGEYKTTTIYPAGSGMGVAKMLTFYRKGSFKMDAQYADGGGALLAGTPTKLGAYQVIMSESADVKKVKVKVNLSLHGIFSVVSAQMVEDEEYEETVKEKRELPAEVAAEPEKAEEPKPEEGTEKKEAEAAEGEKKDEKKVEAPKAPEKKYEWVEVVKKRKRTKRTDLVIEVSDQPGLAAAALKKLTDEESATQAEMKDIIETDEKRNDLEAYIFNTRDKISNPSEWAAFVTDADRDSFNGELQKAEDWLYDAVDPTKAQYVDKLTALKLLGDPIAWRVSEDSMRGQWVEAVVGTIKNYRSVAVTPGDKYSHIAPEKLEKIIKECDDLQKWLDDNKAKQEKLAKTAKPVLLCVDLEKQNCNLAKMADEIFKEQKPAPPKEEKPEAAAPEGEKKDEEAKPAEAAPAGDAGTVD